MNWLGIPDNPVVYHTGRWRDLGFMMTWTVLTAPTGRYLSLSLRIHFAGWVTEVKRTEFTPEQTAHLQQLCAHALADQDPT